MSWADSADRALAEVFADLPRDVDPPRLRRLLRDAYPFGERKYHPYKAWLKRVAAWKTAHANGMAAPMARRIRSRDCRSPEQMGLL